MNPTNYINTLQRFIQHLSYHFQHMHAHTHTHTHTQSQWHTTIHAQARHSEPDSRGEMMGLEGRFIHLKDAIEEECCVVESTDCWHHGQL